MTSPDTSGGADGTAAGSGAPDAGSGGAVAAQILQGIMALFGAAPAGAGGAPGADSESDAGSLGPSGGAADTMPTGGQ